MTPRQKRMVTVGVIVVGVGIATTFALQAFNTIESRLGLADQDPLKEPMVKNIRALKHLADTVIAFEAIPLEIQGVALYEGRDAVALINGEPFTEGEMVGEELLVQAIRTDQIEFAGSLASPFEAGWQGQR